MHSLPDRENIERRVKAIPRHENFPEAVQEKVALAVNRELEKNNPNLHEVIKGNIHAIYSQVKEELGRDSDSRLVTTEDQLRGIIAKAAIAGASQVLHSVGGSLAEIYELESELNLETDSD